MAPSFETQGPVWDESQLLELDRHAAVSRGYVLRHHDPETKWRYVGNGYYEAHAGRPNTETENIQGVSSTADSNSEVRFVITLEHEPILDSLQPSNSVVDLDHLESLTALEYATKEVVRIHPHDPETTTLSPSETSFLHLVVAWQYSTQSTLSSLEKLLGNTIKELRTRRPHGQPLLPRFHDLVREAQYQFPRLWELEVGGMAVEMQQDFAAQRVALHLRAVRDLESEGSIGGLPVSWKMVEKGLKLERWKDIIRGRPASKTSADGA